MLKPLSREEALELARPLAAQVYEIGIDPSYLVVCSYPVYAEVPVIRLLNGIADLVQKAREVAIMQEEINAEWLKKYQSVKCKEDGECVSK